MYSAKTLDVQCKNTVHAFALLYIRKKSTNQWLKKKKVHIEQIKSTITFTHSLNKCHNIFTKYLFLVVVGHSFIFYYFDFDLIIRNWHLNNCENIVKFVVFSITIYIKGKKIQTEGKKKKM